jgi:hypothetical protein
MAYHHPLICGRIRLPLAAHEGWTCHALLICPVGWIFPFQLLLDA